MQQPKTESKMGKETGASAIAAENLITLAEPGGMAAEDYRTLRTSLLYTVVDNPPKVVVVTSPGPKEGKSTTCANLGVVLAQADKSTLIIDCDFRRPAMHQVFGLRNFKGVVNVLANELELQETWHEPVPFLKVATVGPLPSRPAELLGSKRFSELLEKAREQFDYVLLDAPPTAPVSDPAILATQGDGVLLVLDAQKTRKASLRKAKRTLDAVGASVLGTVMNNVKGGQKGLYSAYSY
ncbi:polysaccharide biosynthesis tyrosine autokinase [Rubrobacter tropicus]|uniref:non-specific protein-tyrosine kinase n=1 Tax=Rubrobacter tropicus TaxID=2653851 RepID=A0A6G8QDQ0_9ACTN|nr:CpsD/CapB family tyrosine-protein kinase [Rubrobacter tropicus]QIN84377.1 polysaccharide biosynthesis tyrosine autokinase [Rubrobacter tropicus]